MRVIAGSCKGVRLAPVPPGVRPVSDVVREGLFSSLGDRVVGARVLDLYAGTGALGIEALSRGASTAVFVERSRRAARTIRDNLERTRLASRAVVRVVDVRRFVMNDDKSLGPFNLGLLDPPYETGADELGRVLAALASGWLARRAWTVALTRGIRSSTPVIPVDWRVTRRLEYGDTLVLVCSEV